MRLPWFTGDGIPLILAPMAGVSEAPFRQICRRFGADILMTDVIQHASGPLAACAGPEAITQRREPVVSFSPEMARSVNLLREFLFEQVYTHPVVERMSAKASGILERLFGSLTKDIIEARSMSARLLPRMTRERLDAAPDPIARLQVIVDFLAGMTDRFATEFYRVLFEPDEKGITSLY